MSIDIRNINEVTFSQSFRGYSTEEVDDFLDELYEEAVANNKKIEELKRELEQYQSGEITEGANGSEISQEEAYSIISNAQEEADRILDAARQKAHAMLESAEQQASKTESAAPVSASNGTNLSDDAVTKLKQNIQEMYQKQMAVLDSISSDTPEAELNEAVKTPEAKEDVPSVSFAGLTKKYPNKMPAERDILSEISAIGIDNTAPPTQPIAVQPEQNDQQEEPDSDGLAFAFAVEDDDPTRAYKASEINEAEAPQEAVATERVPEDPDDIIAQILRDNNRN